MSLRQCRNKLRETSPLCLQGFILLTRPFWFATTIANQNGLKRGFRLLWRRTPARTVGCLTPRLRQDEGRRPKHSASGDAVAGLRKRPPDISHDGKRAVACRHVQSRKRQTRRTQPPRFLMFINLNTRASTRLGLPAAAWSHRAWQEAAVKAFADEPWKVAFYRPKGRLLDGKRPCFTT